MIWQNSIALHNAEGTRSLSHVYVHQPHLLWEECSQQSQSVSWSLSSYMSQYLEECVGSGLSWTSKDVVWSLNKTRFVYNKCFWHVILLTLTLITIAASQFDIMISKKKVDSNSYMGLLSTSFCTVHTIEVCQQRLTKLSSVKLSSFSGPLCMLLPSWWDLLYIILHGQVFNYTSILDTYTH